jgi:hypothetical protein
LQAVAHPSHREAGIPIAPLVGFLAGVAATVSASCAIVLISLPLAGDALEGPEFSGTLGALLLATTITSLGFAGWSRRLMLVPSELGKQGRNAARAWLRAVLRQDHERARSILDRLNPEPPERPKHAKPVPAFTAMLTAIGLAAVTSAMILVTGIVNGWHVFSVSLAIGITCSIAASISIIQIDAASRFMVQEWQRSGAL